MHPSNIALNMASTIQNPDLMPKNFRVRPSFYMVHSTLSASMLYCGVIALYRTTIMLPITCIGCDPP